MKKIIVVFSLLVLLNACKNGNKEQSFDAKSYEVVKETLEEKERKNPSRFLVVETKDRKNLFGQTVVKGTISNSATVAAYKNIALKLSFFSKTGVKLDEVAETIYEKISPGQTIQFKTKYFAPKGTDSVAVLVLKAGTAD